MTSSLLGQSTAIHKSTTMHEEKKVLNKFVNYVFFARVSN